MRKRWQRIVFEDIAHLARTREAQRREAKARAARVEAFRIGALEADRERFRVANEDRDERERRRCRGEREAEVKGWTLRLSLILNSSS